MKKHKRLISLLLTLLAVVMLLPVHAFAAGRIDPNINVSLTISCYDHKIPLTGARFHIYLVATVDEYGELTTTEPFRQFRVDIRGKDDKAWRTIASTLEGYVLRDQIPPTDSAVTDSEGSACFPTQGKVLTQGLYLVLGDRHVQGNHRYDPTPFMVMLPSQDLERNTWNYAVTANAKFDISEIPDRPDKPDTVTLQVLKSWKDTDHEETRPKEVIVQLLKDGVVYDTVTLRHDNNWRYRWRSLDAKYKWTVVEKEVDGYTVEITREGDTFLITNTYSEDIPDEPTPIGPGTPDKPTEPEKPSLPQTGQLWWPVPVLIAAGLLSIVIGLIRRRGAEDE